MATSPRPASKSQDSADMPVKMTFKKHVALKLRASHVFSTSLQNVILRGMSAVSWLLQAGMGSEPIFVGPSWRHQNQISPSPPNPRPPRPKVKSAL